MSVKNKPFFSVIIPTYNSESTIKDCLDSIFAQNFPSLEVILVDDNCTDATIDIAKSLYGDKINIIKMEEPYNTHVIGSVRQCGLDHANGDWVVFIDSDDEFLNDCFHVVQNIIYNQKLTTYCFTSFLFFVKNYPEKSEVRDFDQIWLHGKWFNRKYLFDNNIKFDNEQKTHEDIDFLVKFHFSIGGQFFYHKFLTYKYVMREDSITHTQYESKYHYVEYYFDNWINSWYNQLVKFIDSGKEVTDYWMDYISTQVIITYIYMQAFCAEHDYDVSEMKQENFVKVRSVLEFIYKNFLSKEELLYKIRHQNPKQFMELNTYILESLTPFIPYQSIEEFLNT